MQPETGPTGRRQAAQLVFRPTSSTPCSCQPKVPGCQKPLPRNCSSDLNSRRPAPPRRHYAARAGQSNIQEATTCLPQGCSPSIGLLTSLPPRFGMCVQIMGPYLVTLARKLICNLPSELVAGIAEVSLQCFFRSQRPGNGFKLCNTSCRPSAGRRGRHRCGRCISQWQIHKNQLVRWG